MLKISSTLDWEWAFPYFRRLRIAKIMSSLFNQMINLCLPRWQSIIPSVTHPITESKIAQSKNFVLHWV